MRSWHSCFFNAFHATHDAFLRVGTGEPIIMKRNIPDNLDCHEKLEQAGECPMKKHLEHSSLSGLLASNLSTLVDHENLELQAKLSHANRLTKVKKPSLRNQIKKLICTCACMLQHKGHHLPSPGD